MKIFKKFLLVMMCCFAIFSFVACDNLLDDKTSTDDDDKSVVEKPSDKEPEDVEKPVEDSKGFSYTSESNGTLKIANNTGKDMVIFIGQTPSINNILGGVKAGSNRFFDISDDVDDFEIGGYLILRGMSEDEYIKNKSNLSRAKIEYSAMATYGKGKKFSTEINPSYTGNYYFRVTNMGKIGIELRKDSPDGEKLGYLPALATNYTMYADSPEGFTIYPVYVYYSKTTGTVNTIKADDLFDGVTIGPRPLTDGTVYTIELPAEGIKWEDIVDSLSSPVAYITCTNNVTNQGAYFTKSGSARLMAQNGYDLLNPGEINTFEISSTDEGTDQNLIVTLYNGAIKVPVKDAEGNTILIKNGYDYTVTISYNGEGAKESSNYSATIVEVAKRDLSDEIESL